MSTPDPLARVTPPFADKVPKCTTDSCARDRIFEAAKNLFKTLRQLDKQEFDVILAESFPAEGLGRAINDRLMRAQAENK